MVFYVALLVFCSVFIQINSAEVLEDYIKSASPCEDFCDSTFSDVDLETACKKGCRLYKIIGLAKDLKGNVTENSCLVACKEAYGFGTTVKACNDGCKHESNATPIKQKEETQTLHLLTPFMYVKSAYKTVVHHVKQLVTTSFTLYVEEDSGKMVILKSSPKTVIDLSDYNGKNSANDAKMQVSNWQTERADWMDCISQQSGLPRWILVSVLFGFIVALLWLCCVTTVTAPNHHLSSNAKKVSTKNDVGYLCLYEPVDKYKVQPPAEAPWSFSFSGKGERLPVKVNVG